MAFVAAPTWRLSGAPCASTTAPSIRTPVTSLCRDLPGAVDGERVGRRSGSSKRTHFAWDWIARLEWPRVAFAPPSDFPVDGEREGRRSGSSSRAHCRLRTPRSSIRIIQVDALSTANAKVVDQDHLDWRAVDGKREEWSIRIIQVDALSTSNGCPGSTPRTGSLDASGRGHHRGQSLSRTPRTLLSTANA
jgi:hypothetical protein